MAVRGLLQDDSHGGGAQGGAGAAEAAFRHAVELATHEAAAAGGGGETTAASEAAAAAATATSANAWNNLGLLLHAQFDGTGATGAKLHAAIAAFQTATKLAPEDEAPFANMATSFSAGGAHAEAADAHGKAVALLLKKKKKKKKEEEGGFDMLYRYGVLLKPVQRLREAEAAYEGALALRPASADALHNLGDVQLAQGAVRRGEAVASFRRAIAAAAPAGHFHALNSLGNAHLAALPQGAAVDGSGAAAAAEEAYRSALEVRPDTAAVFQNLGMALLRQGKARYGEAAEAYAQVVRLQPQNVQAATTLRALQNM